MLVLSRKVGERVVVPHVDLTVTVLEVRGKVVRLGISAPADVDVHREEVWCGADQATGPRRRTQKANSAPCHRGEFGDGSEHPRQDARLTAS